MPRFLAPITVGQETVTGTETISGNQIILSGTFGKDSYWTSVSASGGLSADHGSFVNNLSASYFYGDGSHLTGVIHNDDYRLTDSRAPSGVADGDLSGTYPSPTVAKIQGNIISTQTPANGQVLQWNGTAWGPGSIPTGGSGGGGVVYFFNQALSAQSPTTNLPLTAHQMGRVALSGQTILTSEPISQADYTLIGGYVTDVLDPQVDYIPAGIFDFNVWAYSNANVNNPTVLQALVYTYDGVNAPVLISTSPDATLTNNGLYVQIPMSCLVPQTDVELTTRIYIEFRAKASAASKTVTIGFGNVTPSHVHTTIPSIGGSGLVKVIDGVWQSPASLLVDVDVAANAEINQTKVAGLTAALASKLPLTGGTLTGGITGTTADFTGAVYGSTAVAGTSSLQLATTAFVQDNLTTGLASGTAIASTVVALVTNADSVTLTRGTVVYSYGSQGDRVSVRMASASAEATSSKTLGLVNETIAVGQTGYVTLYGAMDKLDLGSPFVAGDPLWLGTTPGTFTRTKPVAPIHLVYLGVVQRANAGNGTAYIKVQNGYELNEIHDVLVATPLSAQILQRNDDNTLWINKTPLFNDTQIINSGKWNTAYSVATGYQSVSSTYVTLTGTQKLENKTVVDWMTLVRGYNTTPTLLATIATGDVYTYVYNSSPSNVTYYRYIATDGTVDAFYTYYSGSTLSGLVASKSITI